jgi:hypothetical protein
MAMEMKEEVEPVFQRHAQRWATWPAALEDGLNGRLNWAAQRVQGARDVVQNHFELPGQVEIKLVVEPAGAGRIHISTIEPGTEEYPWTGIYFRGVPVRITAVENPGFTFSHWMPNELFDVNNPEQSLELFFEENTEFVAVFEGNAAPAPLSITELMFNPDDQNIGGDWIEIHNNLDIPLNLGGWTLSDNNYFHQYTFPLGTMMGAGEYWILPENRDLFLAEYPDVEHVNESLGFAFSNSMDQITLKNAEGMEYISFSYSDTEGNWLLCSDGCGHTRGHDADNQDYATSSWYLECEMGSPGTAFVPCEYDVIVNEINYNSAEDNDAGDWLELANRTGEEISLNGWTVRDGGTGVFSFAPGQTIPADGFLVVSVDTDLFTNEHPNVGNMVGPANITLGNNGDMIRVYNENNKLVFSMEYDQYAPWPFEANGFGKTLEFSGSDLGFCNPTVWFAGCPEGSPGVAYYANCDASLIANETEQHEVHLFPNPATDRLFVQNTSSGLASLEILDASGRLISQRTVGTGIVTVTLDHVTSGFYLMRLTDASGITSTGRFLKE